MNTLALRLKELGKTQNLSIKMLCLSLTICLLAVGTISFAASNTTDSFIQVSKNADRTNAVPLNGASVKGDVYIFTPAAGVLSTTYFLDTNGVTSNDVLTSGKRKAPFDFAYTQSDGKARGFNTTTLSEGKHTLIATTRTGTNTYVKHVSEFIVDNVPDTTLNTYIKVSKSADRSSPSALNGSTVSGLIYIHLDDKDAKSAAYFLDTKGNYNNSVMTTGSKTFPFDFQYKEDNGNAKAFDTNKLTNGVHELAVTVLSKTTSKYSRHIVTFTVNNTNGGVQPSTPTTPTTPTTTIPVSPQNPTTIQKFAGDVSVGNVRWGAGIGGNSDPVARHGAELGNRMGLRRTFWSMNNTSGLLSTAKTDLAAGRVPWVSVKLNGSWKENGDGKYDAQMTALLTQLSALDGPVWFTAHHEPEGGCRNSCAANGMDDIGGPSEWLRMQANTSKLLAQLRAQGKGNNIAFAPILMGWTWEPQSGRTPTQWYQAGIWDFAGIDVYTEKEATTSPFIANGLPAVRKFYGERGLKVAIGEWGVHTQNSSEMSAGEKPTADEERIAGDRVRAMYRDILTSGTDGKGAQIIGAAYFDSGLNSPTGSWELTGNQLSAFRELLVQPTSVKAKQK